MIRLIIRTFLNGESAPRFASASPVLLTKPESAASPACAVSQATDGGSLGPSWYHSSINFMIRSSVDEFALARALEAEALVWSRP